MTSPTRTRAGWWLAAALLALSAVPVGAGAMRLRELGGGAPITPENARFFAAPVPVVVHIVAATLFSVLGAFQFVPQLRRRSGWHRRAGGLLTVCGLVVGLSGLWMTQLYPRAAGDGDLVYAFRLLFGSAMVASIVLAVVAIRRRDWVQHGAWMTRGYAIGMGAATQVLTHAPFFLLVGKPGELARGLLMGAGWVINLAVAEWAIRRVPRARSGGPLQQSTSREHDARGLGIHLVNDARGLS
jgi:hypothetical protein